MLLEPHNVIHEVFLMLHYRFISNNWNIAKKSYYFLLFFLFFCFYKTDHLIKTHYTKILHFSGIFSILIFIIIVLKLKKTYIKILIYIILSLSKLLFKHINIVYLLVEFSTHSHNHGENRWLDSCPEDNRYDTLPKEGKPQKFNAVKLTGREKCGRKSTTNRDNRCHEKIVKKSRFKELGELYTEWTEAAV